jgi:hypothetical protein
MPNYHIVKNKDGGWKALKENSRKASGNYSTQEIAQKKAKVFLGNSGGGEVRIHGRDGKIRDSDTVPPAKDPNPPKDKKH